MIIRRRRVRIEIERRDLNYRRGDSRTPERIVFEQEETGWDVTKSHTWSSLFPRLARLFRRPETVPAPQAPVVRNIPYKEESQ
jgi:hypothetical protein